MWVITFPLISVDNNSHGETAVSPSIIWISNVLYLVTWKTSMEDKCLYLGPQQKVIPTYSFTTEIKRKYAKMTGVGVITWHLFKITLYHQQKYYIITLNFLIFSKHHAPNKYFWFRPYITFQFFQCTCTFPEMLVDIFKSVICEWNYTKNISMSITEKV